MNFRADYKYHVMNGANGKIVFSCDSDEDAKWKAEEFAKGSGGTFVVLHKTAAVQVEKVVMWDEGRAKPMNGRLSHLT